jgi:hypothetical protein
VTLSPNRRLNLVTRFASDASLREFNLEMR